MPLLILGTLGAIWTLRHDRQFVSLALLAAVAVISGTGFYSLVEGLRFVDALYFSVVTLTTVGYGDFAPQTDAGKIFTAVYVLVGVGILLAFITTVATKVSQMSLLHASTGRTTQSGAESRNSAGFGVPRLSATKPRYVVPGWPPVHSGGKTKSMGSRKVFAGTANPGAAEGERGERNEHVEKSLFMRRVRAGAASRRAPTL